MSIVSLSYFQSGYLNIPNNNNINAQIEGVPSSGNDLQLFIDIYERELLINALGIVLYNEFEAELPAPTTPKWVKLLNGDTYEINNVSYRWDGLIGSESQSLIAFYIFCQYLRNDYSIYTTQGTVLPDAANSQNVDPTPKYINCFNQFISQYQGEYDYDNCGYPNNNPNVIINCSGMIGLDYYNQSNSSFVSMYKYMTDQNTLNPDTYPGFRFKFYKRENSWGL